MNHETAAASSLPRPFRVVEARRDSWDTFTLVLDPVDHSDSCSFVHGQFNMLHLAEEGEIPVAITARPREARGIVHTVRAPGKLSKTLEKLKAGDTLDLRGPLGSSWPMDALKGHDLVIVADGIGLSALRPVLYFAHHHRKDYGQITIFYATRSPADILKDSEFEYWRRIGGFHIEVIMDAEQRNWRSHVEVVADLMDDLRVTPSRTSALICGPETLMKRVIEKFVALGLGENDIFLALERELRCKRERCCRCMEQPNFTCKEAAVFPYSQIKKLFSVNWELQN